MIDNKLLFGIPFLSLFSFSLHADQQLQKSLLDAVRSKCEYLSEAQLITISLMFQNDFAYFCGTASSSDGEPVERNELLEVYDMVMLNDNGKWTEVANFNSLAKRGSVTCHLKNADDMENIIKEKSNTDKSCSEPDKNNPERKSILDAIRTDPKEKFIVKRICTTPKVAYFCGAKIDKDGSVMKTGNAVDVFDFILEKGKDNRWHGTDNLGLFAKDVNSIKCYFGNNDVILNENTLVDFLKESRVK
ncbi:hypothetical protein FCJ48_18265 [Salmonella enterica]|nr:hypothetical protein [Salmonella enterica]